MINLVIDSRKNNVIQSNKGITTINYIFTHPTSQKRRKLHETWNKLEASRPISSKHHARWILLYNNDTPPTRVLGTPVIICENLNQIRQDVL